MTIAFTGLIYCLNFLLIYFEIQIQFINFANPQISDSCENKHPQISDSCENEYPQISDS